MSFELEFLSLDKAGTATVIDREHCLLDLAIAKIKAQHALDEKRTQGGVIEAVRIRDAAGQEILIYRDRGNVLAIRPPEP
jgi:hypothetical protein